MVRFRAWTHRRTCGTSFIDALVGSALMIIVFLGIFGSFQLATELVNANKSKAGAVSIANDQIEFIRSLDYAEIGTDGGIVAGVLASTSVEQLNGVTYTKRIFVNFVDDDADGLATDPSPDTDDTPNDYKVVKVEVSWTTKSRSNSVAMVTNIVENELETDIEGDGTLSIDVIDADSIAVNLAEVRIVNTAESIDQTAFTNISGNVTFPGSPAAPDYQVTVTKPGFSTDRTYGGVIPNPNPAHLTVATDTVTSWAFAIDATSTITLKTMEEMATGSRTHTFDGTYTHATSNTEILTGPGEVQLLDLGGGVYASAGTLTSDAVAPTDIAHWKVFTVSSSTSATATITYSLEYLNATTSNYELIPDSVLAGNAGGLTNSTLSLLALDTSVYTSVRVVASLNTIDTAVTPVLFDWTFDYVTQAAETNMQVALVSEKIIGQNSATDTIPKFSGTSTTDSNGATVFASLEWGNYEVLSLNRSGTNYDIASVCQPTGLIQDALIAPDDLITFSVTPGSVETVTLAVVPESSTGHSLLAVVTDTNDVPLADATVRLHHPSPTITTDETSITDICGQVFFTDLAEGIAIGDGAYLLDVSAIGYATQTDVTTEITGTTRSVTALN